MRLLGDCRNSFDEYGDCINQELPWLYVSDFANAVEQHGNNFDVGFVRVVYDAELDVHWFYEI